MKLGLLSIQILIPGCASLKEKRSRLRPLLTRLRKEFNVSVAEVDYQDHWQSALIACAVVSNDAKHNHRLLQRVTEWIENNWRDVDIVDDQIELI